MSSASVPLSSHIRAPQHVFSLRLTDRRPDDLSDGPSAFVLWITDN